MDPGSRSLRSLVRDDSRVLSRDPWAGDEAGNEATTKFIRRIIAFSRQEMPELC